MGSFASSTLPRAKLTNSLTLATASFRFKDIDCCSPPTVQAPKSPEQADLLLDASIDSGNDPNPLRMLRSKNFAVVPRAKSGKFQTQQLAHEEQQQQQQQETVVTHQSPESPSYLSNSEFGTFHPDGGEGSNNPIPLPPRDRNKTIPVNQKRHVRKYPLIIPATGLQRTLNKVTQITPVEEKTVEDVFAKASAVGVRAGGEQEEDDSDQASCNLDVLHKSLESVKLTEIKQDLTTTTTTTIGGNTNDLLPAHVVEQLAQKVSGYTKEFLENNFPNITASDQPPMAVSAVASISSSTIATTATTTTVTTTTTLPATIPAASAILTRRRTASDASAAANAGGFVQRRQPPPPPPPATLTLAVVTTVRDPTYENLDIFQTHNHFCVDTASLHCESILENDAEVGSSSPTADGMQVAGNDTVDGFDRSSFFVPSASQASASLDKSRPTTKATDGGSGGDQVAEQIQPPALDGGELKKSMNFVSCEDLLEFAEKPKGRARGLESDEVRIMSKVLGKKPSPEQCLLTLEFIDWDIHKAIKLCKLQTILDTYNLSLTECREALQTYDWDLHTTALKLKGGGSSGR